MEPVLIPIWPDAGRALGLGRTKMFELVADGEIETIAIGRRRLIPVEAVHEFVERRRRAGVAAVEA